MSKVHVYLIHNVIFLRYQIIFDIPNRLDEICLIASSESFDLLKYS